MPDYDKAIKKPFNDLRMLIFGSLTIAVPIANILIIGFLMECASMSSKKKQKLPEIDGRYNELFKTGIRGLLLTVAYFLPAILTAFFSSGVILIAWIIQGANNNSFSIIFISIIAIAAILASGLILVAVYIIPAAFMRYSEKRFFSSGLDLTAIKRVIISRRYLQTWAVGMFYLAAITVIFSIIPLIGTLIGFYAGSVTLMSLLGEARTELCCP